MAGSANVYVVTVKSESKVRVVASSEADAREQALRTVSLVEKEALPATSLMERWTAACDIFDESVNRIEVWPDDACEDPCECSRWSMYSFCAKHTHFRHIDQFSEYNPERGYHDRFSREWRDRFEAGTAFVLSCYDHGEVRWRLSNGRSVCCWDDTVVAGILACNDDEISSLPISYMDRRRCAEEFLDSFNSWCSGDCWGYTNINTDDSVGGYIGLEHLISDLSYSFSKEAFEKLSFVGKHQSIARDAYDMFRKERDAKKIEG